MFAGNFHYAQEHNTGPKSNFKNNSLTFNDVHDVIQIDTENVWGNK